MRKRWRLLALIIGLILAAQSIVAAERILIQVHLFQGVWPDDQPSLKNIEVLTTSSRPELSTLKDKATLSERELTFAAINALLDLYDLQIVEDLFLHEKWWDGKHLHDRLWDGRIRPEQAGIRNFSELPFDISGKEASYRVSLSVKKLSTQQTSLHTVVSKTKKSSSKEVIVDQELVLEVGDPVIVGVPYEGRAHFMMVLLTVGNPSAERPGQEKDKKPRKIYFFAAPKAVTEVQPSYPRELRRRLIGGQIGLRITIDEKGIVRRVDIEKPVYPYLNYAAVQAFRQWTFEPIRIEGKPVPAAFSLSYNFYPRAYREVDPRSEAPPAGSDSFAQEQMRTLLDRSGKYCQKLAGAVFDFICEETIKETHYSLLNTVGWIVVAPTLKAATKTSQVNGGIMVNGWSDDQIRSVGGYDQPRLVGQIMDPQRTIRNSFVCDYLISRKAEAVGERRIILKENGRKNTDRNKLLNERRFSGLSSLLAPLRVLAVDRQPLFNFSLIGEEKVQGKKTFVIEAMPKSGNEDGIWSAKIWLDKESYQILKNEIEGVPIDGYEDVLDDCAILNIKPIFAMTHEYRTEKNGVLFPFRSKIHAAYPGVDYRGPVEKMAISLAYEKYKFFTVETDTRIIK